MSHGPTHIPSRDVCIYCRCTGVRLTDEHIMPYFIGGAHVLKGASCDNCAKITSRFERDVSRDLWGDARIAYDAPSRRKKNRPKIMLMRDPYNQDRKLRVLPEDYPAVMIFYRMRKAGILQGLPETVDLSSTWELVTPTDTDKIERFTAKYGQRPIMSFKNVPDSFARLLAKVAYGQVLCSLDPDDFRPICVPYILGQKKNISYVVGGRWSYSEMKPGIGYEMRTNCIKFPGRLLIIVEIQIIPNNVTPTYHVLVGDVQGDEEADRVYKKIEATYSFDVTNTSTYKPVDDDVFHWMPSNWPLPAWTC